MEYRSGVLSFTYDVRPGGHPPPKPASISSRGPGGDELLNQNRELFRGWPRRVISDLLQDASRPSGEQMPFLPQSA